MFQITILVFPRLEATCVAVLRNSDRDVRSWLLARGVFLRCGGASYLARSIHKRAEMYMFMFSMRHDHGRQQASPMSVTVAPRSDRQTAFAVDSFGRIWSRNFLVCGI